MMEMQLQIKRIDIDKRWQTAPYKITSIAHAEMLAKWLKQSAPEFIHRVISISNADGLQGPD